MSSYIVALFFIITTPVRALAQTPYFLLDDFGSAQSTGEVIMEHQGSLYIAGQYMIPNSSELHIRITKLDILGQLTDSLVWVNELENGGLNHLKEDAFSITTDNRIIMNVNVGANIHDCIIATDVDLTRAELLECYIGNGVEGISARTQLLVDSLLFLGVGNQFEKNYFGVYDIKLDSFSFVQFHKDSEDLFVPAALLPMGNDLLHIGFRGVLSPTGDPLELKAQLMMQILDKQLNLKEENLIGDNYSFISTKAIFNAKGNLVVSALEGDRSNGEDWVRILRPVLLEIDKNYEILWEKPLGDTTFYQGQRNYTYFRSIATAADNSGYILVGKKMREPLGSSYDGYIMRVDSLGNELWNIVSEDAYADAFVDLYDVIATSDGHYMAVGKRSDRNEDADPWSSRLQTVMIKFDDKGNILERPSSVLEPEPAIVAPVSIYPNPVANLLTIESRVEKALVAKIMNPTGQHVLPDFLLQKGGSKAIDVSTYVPGVYQVILQTEDGQEVYSEQVVITK